MTAFASHDLQRVKLRRAPALPRRWLLALLLLSSAITGCQSKVVDDDSSHKGRSTPALASSKPRTVSRLPFAEPVKRAMRPPRSNDWFADVSTSKGINFAYHDGSESGCFQLLESVGGGVAVLDLDLDGMMDACFAGGGAIENLHGKVLVHGRSAGLFRQSSSGQFENVTNLADIKSSSLYTHGVTASDINSDGFPDLIIAGYGGLQIWLNCGDGSFREWRDSLLASVDRWNVTTVAGDLDNDALIDLYVLTYSQWTPSVEPVCVNDQQLQDICGPTKFLGEQDRCYRNNGTHWSEVTIEAGIVPGNRGLGAVAADVDSNGYLDFFVVNDVEANQLYLNGGTLPLKENGVLAGVAFSNTGQREGSMGVDVGDFDGDGLPDLWYTNYSHQDNSLLRNVGAGGFIHQGDVMGLAGVSRKWVGFGTGFGDFDNDGWPDLYVVNGHVAYERLDAPYFQPSQLFRNSGGKRYQEVTDKGGPYFDHWRSARGSATCDWNNDGALDLIIVHQNEPVALLENRQLPKQWLRMRLIGTQSERTATGARVEVKTSQRNYHQWVIGGGSYLSSSDRRLLFTVPDSEAVTVTVTWLGGATQTHRLTPATYTIVEGADAYEME